MIWKKKVNRIFYFLLCKLFNAFQVSHYFKFANTQFSFVLDYQLKSDSDFVYQQAGSTGSTAALQQQPLRVCWHFGILLPKFCQGFATGTSMKNKQTLDPQS